MSNMGRLFADVVTGVISREHISSCNFNFDDSDFTREETFSHKAWQNPLNLHELAVQYNKQRLGLQVSPPFTHHVAMKLTEGDYFDWHNDYLTSLATAMPKKITVIADITREDECVGGELEIMGEHLGDEFKLGCAVCFPSWIPYRISKVEEGERRFVVAWLEGTRLQ